MFHAKEIGELLAKNIARAAEDNQSTDDICYLENICGNDIPLSPKSADKHTLSKTNFNNIDGGKHVLAYF